MRKGCSIYFTDKQVWIVKEFTEGRGPFTEGSATILNKELDYKKLGDIIINTLMAFQDYPLGTIDKSEYFIEKLKSEYGFKSYGSFHKKVEVCLALRLYKNQVEILPMIKDKYGFEGKPGRTRTCSLNDEELGLTIQQVYQLELKLSEV